MAEDSLTCVASTPRKSSHKAPLLTPVLAAGLSLALLLLVLLLGQQASPAGAATGDLGPWTSTTPLPEALWAFSAAATPRHIYVTGGERAGGTNVATVRRAPINDDDTLGSWITEPSLLAPRIDHGTAVYSNCIYVAGGFSDPGETITRTVEYASINPDGSLSSWNLTSPMNTARAHFGLVAFSRRLYALGGSGASATEFASIQGDCTLTSWQATTTMTRLRNGMRAFTAGGRLYAVGGLGAASRSVERAPILSNGTLGTFTTTISLNTGRGRSDMAVAANPLAGFAYVIGGLGEDTLPSNKVDRAATNPDGTLGAWSSLTSLGTARENMAFVHVNGRIYLLGGMGPTATLTSTVEFATIEGGGPSLSGVVLGPEGDSGIPNLSVLLWSGETSSGPPYTSTRTSPVGYYEFNNLSPGAYTLQPWISAERLDYVSGNRVTVTVQAGQTSIRNLRLAAVDVLGLVGDPSGNPVTRPSDDWSQGGRVSIWNADRTVSTGATANTAGYYKFGGLLTDTYTLQAFAPFTGSMSLLGPSLQRTITFTPGLTQTVGLTLTVPTITGTVMTPNPQVVTRTNVSLYDDKKTIQRNVTSNDGGRFAFGPVPAGAYWVQASPPGDRFLDYAQSSPRRVEVFSGATTYAGVLTLTVPSITGTVALPDGTPQSGAGVSVYNSNHSVSFGVGTDASGRFKVREIPSGDYFVRANPPSGSSYAASLARRVKVTSGATVNAGVLQLSTPCVSGRVVDPNGAPVTRTGVGYYSADPTNPAREGVGVDQNGRFNIGGLASGDYFVQGNPPSGSPYISSSPVRVTVVATDTACSAVNVGDLALRLPGLRGRVVDLEGDPVARAGLSIRKADRSFSTGSGTDENGLFRTSPLPSGDYVVSANPPQGSDLGSSLPITVSGVVSGTTKDAGDIPLRRLNVLGRLLLPDGSLAQRGSVHLYNDSRTVDKHVGIDSRGIFRISGLDPSIYRLELDVPWDSTGLIAPPAQQVTVLAGQTTHVGDISYLPATKHITGQVVKRKADGTTSPVAGAIVNANKDDGKAHASEKTGADGRYTLDIGGGVWLVGVGPDRSSGAPSVDWTYGQPPTSVSFKSDNSEESKTQDFTVVSAGAIVKGTVRLPDGTAPAPDTVSVGVRNDSGFSTGTKLDIYGVFSLRVPGGVYRLGGRSSDPTLSMPALPPFSVGSTEDNDLGLITLLARTSRISGRVKDSSGQGIEDMEVQAWVKGGGGFVSTRTITDGVYSLMVFSGTWQVQARPGPDSDYIVTTPPAELKLGANDSQEANFTLIAADATILGKVVDSGLNVLSDFEGYAFAMRENLGAPPTPMGGTQVKGGVFTLNLPAGSNYRIAVSCPPGCKYTTQEERGLTLSSGETRRLNLTGRGADATIAGSVLDSGGSALQNLRATARAVSPLGMQRTDIAANGTYTMAVTAGTWNMGLWVDPNSGYIWEPRPLSTTASSTVTPTVNFTLTQADSSLSGTVKDPSGNALDGAWVWAELTRTSTTPSRFIRGDTSKDGGKYSLPLPSGRTYQLRATVAEEKGYISPETVAFTITTPVTLTQDLRFRQPDAQIKGLVTLGGSPHSAFVRAWAEKGGRASANAGDDGSYTLSVARGDRWQVTAVSEVAGELYRSDPAVVDVGSTTPITQNLTLKKVGTVPTPVTLSFDASQMQVINLSDGTQVTIPGGALAVSGTVSVLALPKVSVPAQRGAQPVSLGYDLSATDGDGEAITSFLRNVTVVIKYTDEQLAALGTTEDQVAARYWDSTTSTWKTPDNLVQDKENNTLTISTNHFTVFAGILSGEVAAAQTVKIYIPLAMRSSSGGW